MSRLILITLFLCLLSPSVLAGEYPSYPIPRTQVIPIQDIQKEKEYELYIKLPDKYQESPETSYPVIYFTDAIWHIDILSAASDYILEDVILVGISWQKNAAAELKEQYGAHVSRFSDYSYWKRVNPNHPKIKFGQAEQHLTFIRDKVITYIEENFRTQPENRAYFGYSLGGGFGAYILLQQPNTFKHYILGSPSVDLLHNEQSAIPDDKSLQANVFISHGEQEVKLGEEVRTFISTINGKSASLLLIKHAVIPGDHQSAFPQTGLDAVKWLAKQIKQGE